MGSAAVRASESEKGAEERQATGARDGGVMGGFPKQGVEGPSGATRVSPTEKANKKPQGKEDQKGRSKEGEKPGSGRGGAKGEKVEEKGEIKRRRGESK